MGEFFGAVVGNPPYQDDLKKESSIGQRQTKDVYPQLQEVASVISKNTSFIYPATWQKNIKSGLGEFLYENNISQVFNYVSNEVFPEIRGNFPLSIVNTSNGESKEIFINGKFHLSKNTPYFIDSEVKLLLFNKVKDLEKIEAGTRNLTNISNLKDIGVSYSFNEEDFSNPIKILAKKNPGLQSRTA